MVSNAKRMKYVSDNDQTSTDDDDFYSNSDKKHRRPTRTPKCFTKNALLARENRLKKKLYVSSLERQLDLMKQDNKQLKNIVENQGNLIGELNKEMKYLKSVIRNSSDISRLIRNIHNNTGLTVTSSTLSQEVHPWQECEEQQPICDNFEELFGSVDNFNVLDDRNTFEEHNYTFREVDSGDEDDVGVCLHVSKKKVSVEFCATCSENATTI